MVESRAWPSEIRWTLRDWIAASALFTAASSVILWQNARVAVLWDISFILNVASRIAGGQIPYRDFPLAQAPLTFLLQAAFIRLAGRVFFHHVLYVTAIGALSTVLAWRIILATVRGRIAAAWTLSLLLAAPLSFLSVYSIMPNPEYDADCAFWILVAVWALLRITRGRNGRETYWAAHPFRNWLRAFLTGVALVIPLFFKQNMGLPFLLTSLAAILLVLAAAQLRHIPSPEYRGIEPPLALAVLSGVVTALLVAVLGLRFTAGLGNYFYWTVTYAGQRRLPGFDLMLGVYWYPALAWMLPCSVAGLLLLRFGQGIRGPRNTTHESRPASLWAQIAAFLLLAGPFLFALAALVLYYDDADSRGDSFLMIWPVMLVMATVLALRNLVLSWPEPSLRAFVPLILLAAINGTMMSQQLWGSTYGIWPLLVLLLAEMLVFLNSFAVDSGASPRFAPAIAAFVSAAMLVCGGFYTISEDRLSYVHLPDGPALHSAFPALAGMSTPGPYLPQLDEMLRYADANIPFNDRIMLMPGEDPLFFATGRAQPFPTTIWDHTCLPWTPAQIADLARSLHIRWLIVKTDLQLTEDSTPDRAATMDLLMREFTLAAHLRGYDVYRASSTR